MIQHKNFYLTHIGSDTVERTRLVMNNIYWFLNISNITAVRLIHATNTTQQIFHQSMKSSGFISVLWSAVRFSCAHYCGCICGQGYLALVIYVITKWFRCCCYLSLLSKVLDPELFEHLNQNGEFSHFYFCYRWFLLDFKRGLL